MPVLSDNLTLSHWEMQPIPTHWIVALVVLLPFLIACSSVLREECHDRSSVGHNGRKRTLSALLLLLLGLGCSLCVVHAHADVGHAVHSLRPA